MSIVTKYVCDRCGHSQDTNNQMWEVAVCVQHLDSSEGPLKKAYRWLPKGTPIWCRKCCDEIGLIGNWKPPVEAPSLAPPTLEDKLREIIQEEIEAAK